MRGLASSSWSQARGRLRPSPARSRAARLQTRPRRCSSRGASTCCCVTRRQPRTSSSLLRPRRDRDLHVRLVGGLRQLARLYPHLPDAAIRTADPVEGVAGALSERGAATRLLARVLVALRVEQRDVVLAVAPVHEE